MGSESRVKLWNNDGTLGAEVWGGVLSRGPRKGVMGCASGNRWELRWGGGISQEWVRGETRRGR